MAGVSTVWLEFWQMTFFFKNQLLFWYSFRNVWGVFSKFWIFKTKFPYFANMYSSHMYLWELFASRKEYFLTVITPLLLSLHCRLFSSSQILFPPRQVTPVVIKLMLPPFLLLLHFRLHRGRLERFLFQTTADTDPRVPRVSNNQTRLKQILVQQLAWYKFCTIEFKFGLFGNFSSESNRYHYCQNFIVQIGRIVIFFQFPIHKA